MIQLVRNEVQLRDAAIQDIHRVVRDGRSSARHLDVVFCNYADGFSDAEDFLRHVSKASLGSECGKLARVMLANNVRSQLCR